MPKRTRHRPLDTSTAGNIVVILAVILTGLFAVGGFAIESTLYLLKRQEVQHLAQSVAMAAALSFPERELAQDAAKRWYDVLRIHDGKEIAPARTDSPEALNISFTDNKSQVNDTIAYRVSSITIRITVQHQPRIFPVLRSSKSLISVVGEAQAGLTPTDIMLVVENTAPYIQPGSVQLQSLAKRFGIDRGSRYAEQCFSPAYVAFKRGVIKLYDTLSQIGTFRVGVITTTSRTGEPFILAPLGETTILASAFEYDRDQPDFHSTRCAAGTGQRYFPVPENSSLKIWTPPLELTGLLRNFSGGDYGISSSQKLLVRNALWLQESGFSTSTGFIHPRYFFADPLPALSIAADILNETRRDDGFPVKQRYVILLTDDSGVIPHTLSLSKSGVNTQNTVNICARWAKEKSSTEVKLGVLYFGHNRELPGHSYELGQENGLEVNSMRADCRLTSSSQAEQPQGGIFFSETSPHVGLSTADYANQSAALICYALKQAELFR